MVSYRAAEVQEVDAFWQIRGLDLDATLETARHYELTYTVVNHIVVFAFGFDG